MHTRRSGVSTSDHAVADPSARPGHLLNNPAVQRRFYDTNSNGLGPFGPASGPRDARNTAEKEAQLLKKYARCRNRAVWAQALVLFNVVGITLSRGVYLEYYLNIALPDRKLIALSLIPALQVGFLLGTPLFVGWLYHWRGRRSGWSILFFIAALVASGAELAQQWLKRYEPTVVLQGPVLGGALGTLFTLSTLVLSSHYKFNLPLVSMQSGSTGFAGAVVYTVIARQGLGAQGSKVFAPVVTASIMFATLFTALLLIRRVEVIEPMAEGGDRLAPGQTTLQNAMSFSKASRKVHKERGTLFYLAGVLLVFFGLFVFPTYILTMLGQPPRLISPGYGTLVLLTTYSTAAISACISANAICRRNLGPVNTFIAASLLAGAASFIPAWMPNLAAALVCGGAYGLGLGAIFALHIKVSTVFHHEKVVWHPDMPARAALVMVLCAVSAFGGLITSAYVLEGYREGMKLVSCMAAGCLGVGGVLIAVARWLRCGKFNVAI